MAKRTTRGRKPSAALRALRRGAIPLSALFKTEKTRTGRVKLPGLKQSVTPSQLSYARQKYFPQLEQKIASAATLKGAEGAEHLLSRLGIKGRSRAAFLAKLERSAQSPFGGDNKAPYTPVRRENGKLKLVGLDEYRHVVPKANGQWEELSPAGQNLARAQQYRQALRYELGLEPTRPSKTLSDLRKEGLTLKDVRGREIKPELDAEKIRQNWARLSKAERKKLEELLKDSTRWQRERKKRASKKGPRRSRGG